MDNADNRLGVGYVYRMPQFFDPDANFFRYEVVRRTTENADKRLGRCLNGFENADGHGMFLYQSKGETGECADPDCEEITNYILEETHHDGYPVSDSIAFVCRKHVPGLMWPQGD